MGWERGEKTTGMWNDESKSMYNFTLQIII
jgi:hypothetical protein